MSRIGKKPITIPSGVTVTKDGRTLAISGPRGVLARDFRDDIEISIDGGEVKTAPIADSPFTRALWGTYASHIGNMLAGVTQGFKKVLILEGVGYRAEVQGTNLKMALGFSHPVVLSIPKGITVSAEKNVLTIEGNNKEEVGAFAGTIYHFKKYEPYKGKGFHYEGQTLYRKQGKKTAA
ncbi:MAG: 50S ribosomal protein L6 [Candidatus Vogelbacteria bacterium]|nr:50S ribosomal protein L6 [Candidatus Vogelbacteria bacterium]